MQKCGNRDDLNIPNLNIPMQALQCIAASPAWGFFMRLQIIEPTLIEPTMNDSSTR